MKLWAGSLKHQLLTLAACAGLAGTVSTTALGDGLLAAGTAAARDLVAVMHERSPGARVGGHLLDTKPHMKRAAGKRPVARRHRAERLVRPDAAPVDLAEIVPGMDTPELPFAAPGFDDSLPTEFAGGGVFIGGGGYFGGGGGGGGGGSSGGGGGGDTPPPGGGDLTPPPPPPPASVVPEPATWAMMLVGFGAVGLAQRRSRRPLPKAIGARH